MDNSKQTQASVSIGSMLENTNKNFLNDSLSGHSVDLDEDILSMTEEPMNNPNNTINSRAENNFTEINYNEEYAELDAFFQSYDSEIQQLSATKSQNQDDSEEDLAKYELEGVEIKTDQPVNTIPSLEETEESTQNNSNEGAEHYLNSNTNSENPKETLPDNSNNIEKNTDIEINETVALNTQNINELDNNINTAYKKEQISSPTVTVADSFSSINVENHNVENQRQVATSLHQYQLQENKPKTRRKSQTSSQSKYKAKKLESKATLFDRILAGLFSLIVFGIVGLIIDFVISVLHSIFTGSSGIFWLFAPFLTGLGFFVGFFSTSDSDDISSVQSVDSSVSGEVTRGIIIAMSIFAIGWLFVALI